MNWKGGGGGEEFSRKKNKKFESFSPKPPNKREDIK